MELLLLFVPIVLLLPFAFVFGIWLLLCWYRDRGQARHDEQGPDLERLWFPGVPLEDLVHQKPIASASRGASATRSTVNPDALPETLD